MLCFFAGQAPWLSSVTGNQAKRLRTCERRVHWFNQRGFFHGSVWFRVIYEDNLCDHGRARVTCPRMLKAADSFQRAGYHVRVVSTNFETWANEADRQLSAARELNWTVVDYSRASANGVRLLSGVRFRIARGLAKLAGPQRLPPAVLGRATGRVFPELVRAACEQPADFFYGGGNALVATEAAARQMHVPLPSIWRTCTAASAARIPRQAGRPMRWRKRRSGGSSVRPLL